MAISLQDIEDARTRIREGIIMTPCPDSPALSELTGARVFAKLDNLQRTGSFKERGARNALLQLPDAARERGAIAASAGNHALGLAYHGKLLGIPITVVMPRNAPLIKRATCERMGARVVLHGDGFQDAREEADRLAGEESLTYVHGYDDPAIIAGQGTMALEILEQVPGVESVVIPIGGAGLLAGCAVALKTLRPEVEIIGVEARHAACFSAALTAGKPVPFRCQPTLADGLAVSVVGARSFALARERVDRIIQVSEDSLALAILRLVELEKNVVEGAAAAPLAAFLEGQLDDLKNRSTVLCFCGGNIDPGILSRVIEKGMAADGRLLRFVATISDRPGGLARLATLIAESGASIKDISHERVFSGPDVSAVLAVCTVETQDRLHAEEVLMRLRASGLPVRLP